ncbi:hypothetical protein BLOT_010369 [Blomia tropicalis]|nr:hypothetical protein BLOT_010369 [Blomia tropicalis]
MAKISNEIESIPLADDDTTDEVTDADILRLNLGRLNLDKSNTVSKQSESSNESIPYISALDIEMNPDNAEEKERLITQVLEVQNTLDDLSLRWDNVKEENLKLKAETQVLGQYIENLVSASSVFQSTSPKMGTNKSSTSSMANSSGSVNVQNNSETNGAAAATTTTTTAKNETAGTINSILV